MVYRMGRERFERLADIFERARTLEPGARSAYLDRACAGESTLRAEVITLLQRHDRNGLLDAPLPRIEAPAAPLPEQIGTFRILECLGRGGMGTVYRAEQLQPPREVALKVMHTGLATEELRRRFEFETSILARLKDPGIAAIYEVGTFDDGGVSQPFFAMELVDGLPLDAYVTEQHPSIVDRLRLFIDICDAVQHAHQKGVIHRDLKPANILVTPTGAAKVLDFGVACATDADLYATMHTSPGQLVGTLAYMSPEQVSASTDPLDTRSDVYALGVILYELLTGQLPYELGAGTVASAIRVIEEAEPRSFTAINRSLRGDLETIARKALRKRPDDRYQSASDLAADVRRHLAHQPIIARPATPLYHMSRFVRRHQGLVAGLVGIVLVLIVGTVAVAWQASLARAEARTRSDIAEFLSDILMSVDPAKTAGEPLTVRAMLDDAAARIDGRFESAPLVRAELHETVGATYFRLGQFEDAEQHLRSALTDFEAATGPRAEATLVVMAQLGLALSKLDRLDEAESILSEAEQRLDGTHEIAADRVRANLAIVLENLGRDAEAEVLYRDNYAQRRDRLGDNHNETLQAQNNLAVLLLKLRRFDECLPLMQSALERSRATLGDDHPETIDRVANLGTVRLNMGDIDGGAPLLREAAQRYERVLGPLHLSTLRARVNVLRIDAFPPRGPTPGIQSQARELLETCARELGAAHRDTLAALEIAAAALALGGDMESAETLALDWHSRLEAELGSAHRSTGRAAYLLKRLYETWEKPNEEAAWQARTDASAYRPVQWSAGDQ
jgi:tetratricopeptide (TPR) repeat protein